MSEKYGIQSKLVESAAATPVSTSTVIVYIGAAACVNSSGAMSPKATRYKAVKCNNMDDYEKAFGSNINATYPLTDAAKSAFVYNNLSGVWFINTNDVDNPNDLKDCPIEDIKSALPAIDDIYNEAGEVPNIICVPRVGEYNTSSGTVADTLAAVCAKAVNISGKLKAQVFYDEVESASQIASGVLQPNSITHTVSNECAVAFIGKGVVGYTSNGAAISSSFSAYMTARRASVDAENAGGVPSRSVGNLLCHSFVGYTVNNTVVKTTQDIATDAQYKGVVTLLNKGNNNYYSWGDHTTAFSSGVVEDERSRFDSSMAMNYNICNRHVLKWGGIIDNNMTLSLRNDIIADANNYLSRLVALGALVGSPRCVFKAVDNTNGTLAAGEFYFTNIYTNVIPAKYIQFNHQYTDEGLAAYTEEG